MCKGKYVCYLWSTEGKGLVSVLVTVMSQSRPPSRASQRKGRKRVWKEQSVNRGRPVLKSNERHDSQVLEIFIRVQ